MRVVCTRIGPSGTAWLTIDHAITVDLVAYLAQEHGCRHTADAGGFCLIAPSGSDVGRCRLPHEEDGL